MRKTKIIPIALIAISLFLMINTVVADEIERTTEDIPIDHDAQNGEKGIEEPLISPYKDVEDITVDIDCDDVVGDDLPQDLPHILDEVSSGDYNPEIAFGAEMGLNDDTKDLKKSSLASPLISTIGLAGFIVLGLIYKKRR